MAEAPDCAHELEDFGFDEVEQMDRMVRNHHLVNTGSLNLCLPFYPIK